MASNRKFQKPASRNRRRAERGLLASAPRTRSRRAGRVPLGLRTTLNQHAAKSLQAAGVRQSGSFPRILRLPRLRAVASGSWPCRQAQHLVPVSWFNHRWTPRVRVRRAPVRAPLRLQVTFKYPQSLTTS